MKIHLLRLFQNYKILKAALLKFIFLSPCILLFGTGCADTSYVDARLFDIYSAPIQYESPSENSYGTASVCMNTQRNPETNIRSMTEYIETITSEHP